MKTWNDYKQHVRETDPEIAEDLDEAEEYAAIITTIIQRHNEPELSRNDPALSAVRNKTQK